MGVSAPLTIHMNNNIHEAFHISDRLKYSPEKSKNRKTTRSMDKDLQVKELQKERNRSRYKPYESRTTKAWTS